MLKMLNWCRKSCNYYTKQNIFKRCHLHKCIHCQLYYLKASWKLSCKISDEYWKRLKNMHQLKKKWNCRRVCFCFFLSFRGYVAPPTCSMPRLVISWCSFFYCIHPASLRHFSGSLHSHQKANPGQSI